MNCPDAVNVCEYLRSKEIQLLPTNTWLKSCINWYKSHVELSNIYGSLQEYVCIQWLLADLQDVQHRCLPTNYEDSKMELTGKYTVQINWMRDIGQSCYSQLQAVQNSNESKSNDYVTADEPVKQNWEPNPKRVLLMEVTDGLTTLKAMEYSPIENLTEPFIPGLKVLLTGPIECRKGIMFLKSSNISIFGGEVDHLFEVNSKKNFLSRCLNINTNNNETQDRGTSDDITSVQNTSQFNQIQLLEDAQTLSHSTPAVDRNHFADNRGRFMGDEDDDFLCQLPDEVLEGAESVDPEHNVVSPVLGERSFINDRQMDPLAHSIDEAAIQRSPILDNTPLRMHKPTLFPSLEYLRTVEKEITPPNTFKKSPVAPLADFPPVLPNINSSFMNSTVAKHCSRDSKCTTKKVDLHRENDNLVEQFSRPTVENKYSQIKKAIVKVESIKKLKIRGGEWHCCANVLVENQTMDVSFNNKVLEKLFGMSATEVEVWRGEMSTNPSLKKKVNDILKTGQTKLKMLNCEMILEHSSNDCIPQVVTIHII